MFPLLRKNRQTAVKIHPPPLQSHKVQRINTHREPKSPVHLLFVERREPGTFQRGFCCIRESLFFSAGRNAGLAVLHLKTVVNLIPVATVFSCGQRFSGSYQEGFLKRGKLWTVSWRRHTLNLHCGNMESKPVSRLLSKLSACPSFSSTSLLSFF